MCIVQRNAAEVSPPEQCYNFVTVQVPRNMAATTVTIRMIREGIVTKPLTET